MQRKYKNKRAGKAQFAVNKKQHTSDIEKLLQALSEGKCKGIGGGTCYKIAEFAKSMGLV